MVRYHEACAAEPFSEQDCKAAVYTYLEHLEALRQLWRDGLATPDAHQRLPFWIRPKAHLLQHLVEEKIGYWGSPSSFWCYYDEAFVGSIKSTCASASRHPATLETVVGEKCMLLAGVDHYEVAHYGAEPDHD